MKIGVFDSGVGGLTALKALLEQFPHEQFVYVGDTARVPYGNKSAATVTRYTKEMLAFLTGQKVDCVVIACNTASALAYPALKDHFPVPLYEVVRPAVKEALANTKQKTIAVIGTRSTIGSHIYEQVAHELNPKVKVIGIACPLFVPFVEEGMTNHPAAELVARTYLAPLKDAHIDTLILGCTHYPLMAGVIGRVMGGGVRLVSSAEAVAHTVHAEVARPAVETMLKGATVALWATDDPQRLHEFAERILRREVPEAQLLAIK